MIWEGGGEIRRLPASVETFVLSSVVEGCWTSKINLKKKQQQNTEKTKQKKEWALI